MLYLPGSGEKARKQQEFWSKLVENTNKYCVNNNIILGVILVATIFSTVISFQKKLSN